LHIISYNIEYNNEEIYTTIIEDEDTDDFKELKLGEIVRIGNSNTIIVLVRNKKWLGFAKFIKGWNGNLTYIGTNIGNSTVTYQKLSTNKGTFFLLVGKNPTLTIHNIKALLMNESYSFNSEVSNERYFLNYVKLPGDIEYAIPAKLTYYDKKGNDITNDIHTTINNPK